METVADADTRKQILSLIKDANGETKKYFKSANKSVKELVKTNRNYQATQEEFLGIFDREDRARAEMQENLIELRFSMRDLMSLEEWQAAFPGDKALLKGENKP